MGQLPNEIESNPIAVAVECVGSQVKLAAQLGESQQTISNWLRTGIPSQKLASVAPVLERITEGRLTRKELCRDNWHRWWPELTTSKAKEVV